MAIKFLNFDFIRNKLVLLILITLAPCLVILLYSGLEQRRHLIETAKSDVLQMTSSMAQTQKTVTQSTQLLLSTLSQIPTVQAMDPSECSVVLHNVLKKNFHYNNFILVDLNGDVIASGKPYAGVNLIDSPNIQKALKNNDFTAGEYVITKVGNPIPSFTFAYPVPDKDGRPKGVLAASLKLSIFSTFYDVSRLSDKCFLSLTDSKGIRLFYYPAQEKTNPIGKPIKSRSWDLATKGDDEGLISGKGSDGVERIFAYSKIYLPSEDIPYMYVWAGIPKRHIVVPANTILIRNLLFLLLVSLILLSFCWVIGQKTLISPIQHLVILTQKYANGDLEARSEFLAKKGELGQLTSAFYDMAESLTMSRAESKNTEVMLRQSNQLLEASQSIAKVGGWELDLTTNNLFWTGETYRIHDTSPAEFNPTMDAGVRYFLSDSRNTIANALEAAMTKGEGYDLILETLTTKGRRIDVRTTCEVTLHEGRPVKLTGIFQDITDYKQAEVEKQKLENQLQQSQKMESIGNLAGGIAHDFNNILSAVLGFTELALDAVDKDTPIAEDLQEVYTAGLRAKNLVQQILTFARQSDEELKPIQVDFIIKEVLKLIRSSIPSTIEIKQNIESDSLIMGSSIQVHRIIMNLCSNAADAMENGGGTLEITLKDITIGRDTLRKKYQLKRGNYIEIKVSDTGDGIEPQVIDKIFDPYFTTKGAGEGTGMGLAMVHGIVETYGGKIFIKSSLGQGTIFTIYLPVARESRAHQQSKVKELPTGHERILFVDDEEQITKMASRMLGQLGYSVTTKTSSEEALELFRLKPNDFDLVISDVTMPQMAGDRFAVELLMIRPDLPVILCTGYSKKLSEEIASEIGIKAFAYKPIVKEDLAKTVRDVLDLAKE